MPRGWVLAVVASLTVACGPTPSTVPEPGGSTGPSAGSENHRPAADADPITPAVIDDRYAGRWSLSHGGSAWLTMEIGVRPGLSARVLSFDPAGSWTEFHVSRVKLGDAGELEITGQYEGYPQTVEIVLRVVGSTLVGTAGGETYGGSTADVRGSRLP